MEKTLNLPYQHPDPQKGMGQVELVYQCHNDVVHVTTRQLMGLHGGSVTLGREVWERHKHDREFIYNIFRYSPSYWSSEFFDSGIQFLQMGYVNLHMMPVEKAGEMAKYKVERDRAIYMLSKVGEKCIVQLVGGAWNNPCGSCVLCQAKKLHDEFEPEIEDED